jgi:hypothetical protein
MEFTTQELAPIAKEFAILFEQKIKNKDDRHIGSLEHEVRKGMNELAVLVLSETLTLAEKERKQTIPCECGGELHYQRRRGAKFESTFGWVSYKRDYYASCKCKKGKSPLDEEFGIVPGKITPELARLLALTGVELPYGESRKLVKEFLLLELSENSVREETQRFGQYQQEREKKLIEETQDEVYLQKRTQIEKEEKRPKRFYGSLDGAHTRINDPSEDEDWREVKVGCWYEVEAVPPSQKTARHRKKEEIGKQALRAKDQQYYCDIQKVEEFAPLFWATGCQAKIDLADELVFLGDGAKWIWKLVEYYYPKAVQIVDWFHAEERLEKVAKDAFSKGTEREKWLENTRTALWDGDVELVIRNCEFLAKHSKEAADAQTYFYNNKKRMRYDTFREKSYMIGSGTIESACKQIVSHRLRCSGAQWKVEGARLTAKARAAWLSKNNDWNIISSMRAKLPMAI